MASDHDYASLAGSQDTASYPPACVGVAVPDTGSMSGGSAHTASTPVREIEVIAAPPASGEPIGPLPLGPPQDQPEQAALRHAMNADIAVFDATLDQDNRLLAGQFALSSEQVVPTANHASGSALVPRDELGDGITDIINDDLAGTRSAHTGVPANMSDLERMQRENAELEAELHALQGPSPAPTTLGSQLVSAGASMASAAAAFLTLGSTPEPVQDRPTPQPARPAGLPLAAPLSTIQELPRPAALPSPLTYAGAPSATAKPPAVNPIAVWSERSRAVAGSPAAGAEQPVPSFTPEQLRTYLRDATNEVEQEAEM